MSARSIVCGCFGDEPILVVPDDVEKRVEKEQEDERDEDDVCGTGADGDREPEEVDDGPAE